MCRSITVISVLHKVLTEVLRPSQSKHIFIVIPNPFQKHVSVVEQLCGFEWELSVNLCGSFS